MRITILFVLAILSLYIDKNIPDTTFAGFEDDIDYSFSLDTNEQRLALLNLYNMTSNSQWNNNWDTSSTMFNFWGVCYDTPTGSPYCLCNTPCVPAIACVSTIDMDGTWSTINCCGPDHLGDGCSQGGGNNLEGTLPENINLPQLKRLILSFNNLNGEIPDFQGIENLEWLVLSCNSFNSIADFQNLPKLTELYIYKNFLNSLPNFSNLGSLEKLLAHRNEISGTIPNFEALFNLRELRLYGNKFEGTIPEFQNSPLLADLRIYENNFTFEDFLPNWDALCNISNVKADTMNLAFESIIYSDIPDSCSFEIDLSFDDTVSSNVYYWFKDGIPFDTIYGNNKLSFSKISLADDGVYSCRITNDTVTPKFDLVLETGAITVNVCESGKLSIDTVLCIGDSLKVNGITYNENNLEGKQILPGSSINGCDSILWINISYLEEAEAGPENIISCQDSIFLMTNLPDFTNGEWTTNSSANIQNPFNPDTWVYQLEEGSFEFYWTLSNDNCFEYDSDTIVIKYESPPVAILDTFHTYLNTPILNKDLLLNDEYNPTTDSFHFLSLPLNGILDTPSFGNINFSPNPFFDGKIVFEYELCNIHCNSPIVCDTALVCIEIDYKFDYNTVITPNGDGKNDVFLIKELNENLSDYPNNQLTIFNELGDVVYRTSNYQNDWGGLNLKGNPLPHHVYFFEFKFKEGQPSLRDKITIIYE